MNFGQDSPIRVGHSFEMKASLIGYCVNETKYRRKRIQGDIKSLSHLRGEHC